MSPSGATTGLERALEISRDLLALADSGDVHAAGILDNERLRLLKAARARPVLSAADQSLLRQIAELNDRAIGTLEHRLRAKARSIDMLAAGRRAVRAYGDVQTTG